MFELGNMKRARRTGWWVAGVRDPESLAEHSHRASLLGAVLAGLEGADPARTTMLAALHDVPETRTGDIPLVGKSYVTAVDPKEVLEDQLAGCPDEVAEPFRQALAEFEEGETPEARCAKDADKLEALIQAVEYKHAGMGTIDEWINSSLEALRTDSAKSVAAAILDGEPLAWQHARADRP
ncbi:HD domain-containing protein [Salininema proteolyticum]|uniref:5'-deoxynucleotidase n=1 Tax=Salininema proteolyticum TaxID=1607685 RepID=A0ABV8U4N4_9ACTN